MLPNPLLHFLFCFDSAFLKRTSSPLGPSPAYVYLLLLIFIPRKKRNRIGLQSIITTVRINKIFRCKVFATVLTLKSRGSLFIFTIQTERRLLKFNGKPWNDRSFRLAELFWQSPVQQNRGIVAYFSLNVNTYALVLVVVVPNSSHVTPMRELAEFVYSWLANSNFRRASRMQGGDDVIRTWRIFWGGQIGIIYIYSILPHFPIRNSFLERSLY